VTRYLEEAGLAADLAELGFALAGYGCMTCIGNRFLPLSLSLGREYRCGADAMQR
jgi:aconitase A